MTENVNEIDLLIKKLESLVKRQEVFSEEIQELSYQIHQLKSAITTETFPEPVERQLQCGRYHRLIGQTDSMSPLLLSNPR